MGTVPENTYSEILTVLENHLPTTFITLQSSGKMEKPMVCRWCPLSNTNQLYLLQAAPFNQRFHVILNVAVVEFYLYPDASTVFPQRMEVDYVRVYQRDPSAEPSTPKLTFTVDTSCTGSPVNSVALTGPWANNWNAGDVVPATDNGDGTWSVERELPNSTTEYLWVVNGNYENLIGEMQNGGSCAPVTDYHNYANRVWNVGEPDPFVAYGRCTPCP